uniref:EGF-like domain-containing protein n=1 Tax=Rhabditophanes sp. KR3021 TaxID=114890 RepID=A0AC35TJQ4_9BILA
MTTTMTYSHSILYILLLYGASRTIHGNDLRSSASSLFTQNQNPVHAAFDSKNAVNSAIDEDADVTFTKFVETDPKVSVKEESSRESKKVSHNTLTSSFKIRCCNSGHPSPTNASLQHDFKYHEIDYEIEEVKSSTTSNGFPYDPQDRCKMYQGNFTIHAHLLTQPHALSAFNATCECPPYPIQINFLMDRSCRKLPKCLNNGYRSLASQNKCICPEPYFGNQCEQKCHQGKRYFSQHNKEECVCMPFYQGPECIDFYCVNGGTKIQNRCMCPSPQFLGHYCEIDTNKTSITSNRYPRYGETTSDIFSRDISGTIFSLIMIIVLVISMYLLMKHRMQTQSRFAARRPDLLGGNYIVSMGPNGTICPAANNQGYNHRREFYQDVGRSFAFRSMMPTDGGPPPYNPTSHRTRVRRAEILPPLPTYEDATKLPPLRHGGLAVSEVQEEIIENEELARLSEGEDNGETSLLSSESSSASTETPEKIISHPLQNTSYPNFSSSLSQSIEDVGTDNGSTSSQQSNNSKDCSRRGSVQVCGEQDNMTKTDSSSIIETI